ncbi:MAG: DUF3108 domain-containing protein [Verrucomicrobia bacterium]|nr:DUF3108 domain-containing protein [Verrucomicrobiota bacterium]
MMRNSLICMLLAVAATVTSADTSTVTKDYGLWFDVGEALIYRVHWGVVPVGTTRVTTEWIEEDGRQLLRIRYRTRTNKVLEKLYPVDDLMETVIDPVTFLPVRFTKNLKEGKYRTHEITTFDFEKLKAEWHSLKRDKRKTFDIAPDTHDIISLMYLLRRGEFKVGDKRDFRVMADEKLYDLSIEAIKTEKIELDKYGEVTSVLVKPEAEFQGLFVRKGEVRMWVSEDDRHIMTFMTGSVPVASIKLRLHKVVGPGDDKWILKDEKD